MRCPQQLIGELLGGVHNAVNRILVHFMLSENPVSLSPSFPSSPVHAAYDSVLWMGQKRNERLWQHPAQLRKLGTYSRFSPW